MSATTVLFVDDETDVTDALRVALRHCAFNILTADSAAAGLEVLRSHEVDVVVSDERMAGTPGSVFLTQVRHEFPGVERMILTGQASIEATIAAINDAHVFRVLTKPCPPDRIAAAIDDALEARSARAAASDFVLERERSRVALSEALETTEVWYQPIFDRQLSVVACEALMRPRSPDLPTPDVLIEAASQLGAHFDVDRRVRATVAAHLAETKNAPEVFVNLLPESLADPVLVTTADPLAVHAGRIVIEVTERADLGVVDDLDGNIASLRGLGYRVALDDLGAGYAGLASFAQLRPDIVKFDISLVRDVDREPTKASLVKSMANVCAEMQITSLAEGIETEHELSTLLSLGCDLFQGYLLAKPAPGIPAAGTPSASL